MVLARGLAALLVSVTAAGSPFFEGTAFFTERVRGTVLVPELASAPRSIAVHWAYDTAGNSFSEAAVASKAYSVVEWRSCGETGSVPSQRRLQSNATGDQVDAKIVNGANAEACKLKWQARLVKNGNTHFCGATILSQMWLLSAAHCNWKPEELDTVSVVAGDLSRKIGESHQVVRAVKQAYVYPDYSGATLSGDFMLIELKEELPFNECIGAACLPSAASEPGTECLVSGWGRLEFNGPAPDILQVAKVNILSSSDCEKKSLGAYKIDNLMICAQGGSVETGIKDGCQGDSGGPLVCKDTTNKYAVQGSVSYGKGCADPKFAGVYSRTVAVLDWIKKSTGLAPGPILASTVPIEGLTPPRGTMGLLVFGVASDGKKTPLGLIPLRSAPVLKVVKQSEVSGSGRQSFSWSFFAFALVARFLGDGLLSV